jgi:hypothetical protein
VQANVLHFGGSQLPKKRDKRTNNDLQSITQKTMIEQHVYVYPRENEVAFLCEFRYLKRIESETAAEYVKSLIKCQTINKFFSKQIPFIEKGTR